MQINGLSLLVLSVIVGKESTNCAQGDSETSSSNQRTECSKASKYDHEMHAVAAPSAGTGARSTCPSFTRCR